jgi:hypothetical protein
MSHPKCKTCAHFIKEPEDWDAPDDFGKCGLIAMTCDMTRWDAAAERRALTPEYSGHLAGVLDWSSYRAELYPDPDFYCAMHSDLMPKLTQST